MTDTKSDLTPMDGLCNVFVEFEGLRKHPNSVNADITFSFVHKNGGNDRSIATMTFPVATANDGFPGMMVRAPGVDKLFLREINGGVMDADSKHSNALCYTLCCNGC